MSEEIKTFIKRLKSDFHLDEIEKSLYFVNQKKILNKRLDTLNEKIADLNEKLGEPEKNNGGFKRACKLDIQDTEIQTYSYEQIAEKPKELGDDQFIYISGNKIYLFKKKTYTIDEINCDWFTSFSKIILENKCLWMVLSEDYKRLFSLRPSDK